jgi:hypothetical protein
MLGLLEGSVMGKQLRTLSLLLLQVACRNESAAPHPASSSTAVLVASGPGASTTTPVPQSFPVDLNETELTGKLDCKSGKVKNACGVWEEFRKATNQRFTGKSPSGESRWFGKAYVVDKGIERTEYTLLVSRPVPTMQVCPSCLAYVIATAPIPDELTQEAVALWRRMSSSRHRGNQKNLSFKFLESYVPKGEQGAINTSGMSVQLIAGPSEEIGYLRQPELKKLLLVRRDRGLDATPGDGTYAEFWQAIW